jgi:hypothetical protein
MIYMTRICDFKGCKRKHAARGYCLYHYYRLIFLKNHPDYEKKKYWRKHKKYLETDRKWRKNNPDKIKLYNKTSYDKNPQDKINRSNEWNKKNRERINKRMKERYDENPNKFLIPHKKRWKRKYHNNQEFRKAHERKNKEWRKNNPDKVLEMSRRWRKNNPIKAKMCYQNYRAREIKAKGSHTAEEWERKLKESKGYCRGWKRDKHYVGIKRLTKDHIIPLFKKGTNYIDNIQPLCKSCNCSKRDNLPK